MRLRRVVDVFWLPVSPATGHLDLPEAGQIIELTFENLSGPIGRQRVTGAWIEVLVERYKEPLDLPPPQPD